MDDKWTDQGIRGSGADIGVVDEPGTFKSGETDYHPSLTKELKRRSVHDNFDIHTKTPESTSRDEKAIAPGRPPQFERIQNAMYEPWTESKPTDPYGGL